MKIMFNPAKSYFNVPKNKTPYAVSFTEKNFQLKSSSQNEDVFFKGEKQNNENAYQWALEWDENSRKSELNEKCDKLIKNLSFFKKDFSYRPAEIENIYNQKLQNERTSVNAILNSTNYFKEDIKNIKAKNKKTKEILEDEKEIVSKPDAAFDIAAAFKIKNKGNLDDKIGGYEEEKLMLREGEGFINQIALEKAGMRANVPNSVLLFGVIGTGKTTFANAIANETACNVIEIPENSQDFPNEAAGALSLAKQNYIDNKQRSIIIINEADLHLSKGNENSRNIAAMKTVLDNCAELPNDKNKNASAATFFFITNHPLDIADEIVFRKEKMGQTIILDPAEGKNVEEVIKFYMKKSDPDKKVMDYENYDFSKTVEKLNPNMKKGAYGNDALKAIVQNSYEEYKENSAKDFEEILLDEADKTTRNIHPEILEQYIHNLGELTRKEYLIKLKAALYQNLF